jgi:hypothetical protein
VAEELIEVTYLANEETLQKFQQYLNQVVIAYTDQYEAHGNILRFAVQVLGAMSRCRPCRL